MQTPTGIDPTVDKDDLNLVFDSARQQFVDMQIAWQPWDLQKSKYCDNGGCDQRRVITAKVSVDGVNWGPDQPLRTPDSADPPELHFYHMRPSFLPNSQRWSRTFCSTRPAPTVPAQLVRPPAPNV